MLPIKQIIFRWSKGYTAQEIIDILELKCFQPAIHKLAAKHGPYPEREELRKKRTLFKSLARFEVQDNGCWKWTGPIQEINEENPQHGYGRVTVGAQRLE